MAVSKENIPYPATHLNSPIRTQLNQQVLKNKIDIFNVKKYSKTQTEFDDLCFQASYLNYISTSDIFSSDHSLLIPIFNEFLLQSSTLIFKNTPLYSLYVDSINTALSVSELQLNSVLKTNKDYTGLLSHIPNNHIICKHFILKNLMEELTWAHGAFLTKVELPISKHNIVYNLSTHSQSMSKTLFAYINSNLQIGFAKDNIIVIVSTKFMSESGVNIKDILTSSLTINYFDAKEKHNRIILFLNKDCLLMIANIISERYCLLVASFLAEQLKLSNYLKFHQLTEILTWGDNIIKALHNNSYNIIRHYEPLVLGSLLSFYEDEYCDNRKFLNAILEDIDDDKNNLTNDHHKHFIEKSIGKILMFMDGLNVHQRCQAFGLYRIWGHPSINIVNGIKKVKKLTAYPKLIHPSKLNIIKCKFKEMFCLNYRRKFGIWPNITVPPDVNNYLADQLRENKMINRHNKFYDLYLWNDIELNKTMDIDTKFNLSTILADKAVSPNKSHVIACYKSGRTPSFLSRRVIMAWLQSNYTDAEEFLQNIDINGFQDDDLIIGVCPKEREMKIDPRLFAVMSLKLRLYFVLTESLLAEYVLPLFPQITMIDDVLKLSKKIYNATKEMSGKTDNEAVIITNIDFEKWNSNMRGELANTLFVELDKIFGLNNIYARTHDIFEKSTIYLTDGTLHIDTSDNDLLDGPGVWHNHLGGFEGLRQKGWTLLTVVILEYIAQNYPINHTILGQGDNQVIICKIRSRFNRQENPELFREDVKNIHNSFLEELCAFLESLGLPLKLRETWISSVLFMYGKEMYYKGMPLSMSQKRLARMFPLANELYPSLENALSTIYCNGNSAAMADLTPIVPFIMSLLQSAECIQNHLDYSPIIGSGLLHMCHIGLSKWSVQLTSIKVKRGMKERDIEKSRAFRRELIAGLLLMPKILGGYPVQNLLDFTNRGFPDPLVQSLSMIMNIYFNRTISNRMKRVIEGILNIEFSPDINAQLLLEDPLSVNILCPTNGVGVIRKQVEDWMQTTDMIKNEQFKAMIKYALLDQGEIDNLLIQGDIYWPRLMHDIHEGTVKGYARSFISKVTKTNTTMNVARESSRVNLIYRLRVSEMRYFNSCHHKLLRFLVESEDTRLYEIPHQCSTRYADKLRCAGWKKKKMLGITTPHPFEAFTYDILYPEGCTSCEEEKKLDMADGGYILAKISDDFRNNPELLYQKLGPSIPYLGSKTIEKIKRGDMNTALNTTPILRRALKLLRTINWFVNPTGHIAGVMRRLVASLTNIDPRLFETSNSAKTGSEEHRYQDMSTKHGGFNMVKYNIASYIHLCTTTLSKYSKGSKNVTLHFQATLCYLQALVGLLFTSSFCSSDMLSVHLHLSCPDCIVPVNTEMIDGHPAMDLIKFPSQIGNPYLWSDVKLITKTYLSKNIRTSPNVSPNICLYAVSLEVMNRIVKNLQKTSFLDDSLTSYIPISWACKIPAVPIFEMTTATLYLYFLSVTSLSYAYKPYSEIKQEFKFWLKESRRSSFLPLATFFYEEHNRVLLSSSKYFIRSPRSTPYTVSAVRTSIFDSLIEIIESDFDYLLDRISNYRNLFFVNIIPPLLSLKLLIISSIINDSTHEDIDFGEWKTIITHIDKFKAQNNLENKKNLSIDAFISYLLTVSSLNSDISPYVVIKFIRWIEGEKIVYYSNSSDFLVKNYYGKTPGELIQKCELSTINYSEFQSLPVAANVMLSVDDKLTLIKENTDIPPNDKTQRTDFSSHFFRSSPLDTSAHYKLASIIHQLDPYISSPQYAVVGGDGTGGFSLFMMRRFPGIKIYYNSYINMKGTLPQILGDFSPASFDGISGWGDRLISFRDSVEGVTDLTDPMMASQIKNKLNHNLLDFFISDMEGSFLLLHDKNFIELINVISLLYDELSPNFIGILKTYINNPTLISGVLTYLSTIFKRIQIMRSLFSSNYSSEIYIAIIYKRDDIISPKAFYHYYNESISCFLFKPNSYITYNCSDILEDLSNNKPPFSIMYHLSETYSRCISEKNFQNKALRQLIFQLRDLCNFEGNIILPDLFHKLFILSHKILKPSSFVPINRKYTRYTLTVSNNSIWQLIKWHSIALTLLMIDPEMILNALTTLSKSWIIGFRTKNQSWGFVLSSLPIFGDHEGFSYTFGFFQRKITTLRQYNMHMKNIYKECSLVGKMYKHLNISPTEISDIKIRNLKSEQSERFSKIKYSLDPQFKSLDIYLPPGLKPQFDPSLVINSMKHASDEIQDIE
nr:MAG: RNA-dependent RNA polymerase [Wufeng shrew rhabdovirus 3]